jgi:hypothetical protein
LIEYIGRKTKNHRRVIVNALGIAETRHLLELADVYHSENMDNSSKIQTTFSNPIKPGNH